MLAAEQRGFPCYFCVLRVTRVWPKCRAILGGQRSSAESASLPASGSNHRDWPKQISFRERLGFLPEFPGLAKGKPNIFGDGCLSPAVIQLYRNRRRGTGARKFYFFRLLSATWRSPGDWQKLCRG